MEHDYFGALDVEADGTLYWSETVELANEPVSVDLNASSRDSLSGDALDACAVMLNNLEDYDMLARQAMLAQLDDRASDVTEFILRQQEELGEEIDEFLVDISGDVPVDVIRSLHLISLNFSLDAWGTKEPFAVMEFALDEYESNDVLLAHFDSATEVSSVTSNS